MQVRLVEGTPDYPFSICNESGMVMARFKDATTAAEWAERHHYEIDKEFPNYEIE